MKYIRERNSEDKVTFGKVDWNLALETYISNAPKGSPRNQVKMMFDQGNMYCCYYSEQIKNIYGKLFNH